MKILSSIILCLACFVSTIARAEVGETTVIDAIGTKPNSSEAVLLLHQMRPWNKDVLELFVKKLDFYQTVIRSGALEKQRPDLNGKNFRIVVIYAEQPTEDAAQLLTKTQSSMLEQQIILRWGFQKQIPELVSP